MQAFVWYPTRHRQQSNMLSFPFETIDIVAGGEKVAEHSGERSKAAMLKFLAENSDDDLRTRSSSRSSDL